ncbi:MAG: PRC-barrel domain-containing protein [Desulfopila sp.]
MRGYSIKATDTDIGHIKDFILDEETWIIRYLIVDTGNCLPGGKKVIIPPQWVEVITIAIDSTNPSGLRPFHGVSIKDQGVLGPDLG